MCLFENISVCDICGEVIYLCMGWGVEDMLVCELCMQDVHEEHIGTDDYDDSYIKLYNTILESM